MLKFVKVFEDRIEFQEFDQSQKVVNEFIQSVCEQSCSFMGVTDKFSVQIASALCKNDFAQLFQLCLQKVQENIEIGELELASEVFEQLNPYFEFLKRQSNIEVIQRDQSYLGFQQELFKRVCNFVDEKSIIQPLEVDKLKTKYYGILINMINELKIGEVKQQTLQMALEFIKTNQNLIQQKFMSLVYNLSFQLQDKNLSISYISKIVLQTYEQHISKFLPEILQCIAPTIFCQISLEILNPIFLDLISTIFQQGDQGQQQLFDFQQLIDVQEFRKLSVDEAEKGINGELYLSLGDKVDKIKQIENYIKQNIEFLTKIIEKKDNFNTDAEHLVDNFRDSKLIDIKSIIFFIKSCILSGQHQLAIQFIITTENFMYQFLNTQPQDISTYPIIQFLKQLIYYIFIPNLFKSLDLQNQCYATEQIVSFFDNKFILSCFICDHNSVLEDYLTSQDFNIHKTIQTTFKTIKQQCIAKEGDFEQYSQQSRQHISKQIQTISQKMQSQKVPEIISQSFDSIIIQLVSE